MPVSLPHYAKIKDKCCLCYFGNNKEYLIQLKLLRPIIESTLKGLQIYLSCNSDDLYLLENEERILTKEEFKEQKINFAYTKEFSCDMKSHPIEEFLDESEIPKGPVSNSKYNDTYNCILLTTGVLPTKSLEENQIKKIISSLENKGIKVQINCSIKESEWVIGVENEQLFEAAALGKKVTLIDTGLGKNLFKSMFPNSEIISL